MRIDPTSQLAASRLSASSLSASPLQNASSTASVSPSPSPDQLRDAAQETTFQDKLEAAAKSGDLEGLRDASREFEAYFVGQLLKQMRKTVLDGGLIAKSEARKQFESMLDDELAKQISSGEGLGLAKTLYEAMRRAYE